MTDDQRWAALYLYNPKAFWLDPNLWGDQPKTNVVAFTHNDVTEHYKEAESIWQHRPTIAYWRGKEVVGVIPDQRAFGYRIELKRGYCVYVNHEDMDEVIKLPRPRDTPVRI